MRPAGEGRERLPSGSYTTSWSPSTTSPPSPSPAQYVASYSQPTYEPEILNAAVLKDSDNIDGGHSNSDKLAVEAGQSNLASDKDRVSDRDMASDIEIVSDKGKGDTNTNKSDETLDTSNHVPGKTLKFK